MTGSRKQYLKDNLEWNIRKWAGVDVQILHRFRFVPAQIKTSLVLEIFDIYKNKYLTRPEADGAKVNIWFFSSKDALDYLRGLYMDPLGEDENYDIVIKKKGGEPDDKTEI